MSESDQGGAMSLLETMVASLDSPVLLKRPR
jgi:hypothetical protein